MDSSAKDETGVRLETPINKYVSDNGLKSFANYSRYFRSKDFIMVSIGTGDAEPWLLPRGLLFSWIPCLKTRLDDFARLHPDQDNTLDAIRIRKVEPSIFEIAVDWFFNKRLECRHSHTPQDSRSCLDHFSVWSSLHVFAENYELAELSAEALKQLGRCLTKIPWNTTPMDVRLVFKTTKEDSVLRKILVKEVVKTFIRASVQEFKEHSDKWVNLLNSDPHFHADVMLAIKLKQNMRGVRPGARLWEAEPPNSKDHFREVIDLTDG